MDSKILCMYISQYCRMLDTQCWMSVLLITNYVREQTNLFVLHVSLSPWGKNRWNKREKGVNTSSLFTTLFTWVQRIADISIAAHVFIKGFHPYDLRACRGLVRDDGFIAWAEESRWVVITVLHMNHYLHKVSLHRDLLVTHLQRCKIMVFVSGVLKRQSQWKAMIL